MPIHIHVHIQKHTYLHKYVGNINSYIYIYIQKQALCGCKPVHKLFVISSRSEWVWTEEPFIYFLFYLFVCFSVVISSMAYFDCVDEGDPLSVRCVCTFSRVVPLHVIDEMSFQSEISKHQPIQTTLRMLTLYLAAHGACWQIQSAQQPDSGTRGEGCTFSTFPSCPQQFSRVILSARWTCLWLRLWSDLTVQCLGELQACPRSVGNQQRVGLDCSVLNYRGGWRGPGCDFPGMEPVQDCD